MNSNLKNRIAQLLDPAHSADVLSRGMNIGLMVLIFLNVLTVILETVPSLANTHGPYLKTFEVFSVLVFTIEYVLRVWVCDRDSKHTGFKGRAKFMLSPLTPHMEASLIGRTQQGGIGAVVEPPTPLLITMPSRKRTRPSEED